MDILSEDGVEFQKLKGISPCKDWEEREKRFVYILGECFLTLKTVLKEDTTEEQLKEWFSIQEGNVEKITTNGKEATVFIKVKDQPTLFRLESSLGNCDLIETAEGGVTDRNEAMMLCRLTSAIFHSSKINCRPAAPKRPLLSYGAAVTIANGYSEIVKSIDIPLSEGRFIKLVDKPNTTRLVLSPSEHVRKSYGKLRTPERMQLELTMRISDVLQLPSEYIASVEIQGAALSPFSVLRVQSELWEGAINRSTYITNNPIIVTEDECLWYDTRQRKVTSKTEGVAGSSVFTWPTPAQVAADLNIILSTIQKTNIFVDNELLKLPSSMSEVAKDGKSNFQEDSFLKELLLQNDKSLTVAKRVPPTPPPKNVTSPNPVGIVVKEREVSRDLPQPEFTKKETIHRERPPAAVETSFDGHSRDEITSAMMRIVKQRRAGFIWCKEIQRDSHLADEAKLNIDVMMAGEIIAVQKGIRRDRNQLILTALKEGLDKMNGRVISEDIRSAKSVGSLNWRKVHSFTDLDATISQGNKKQQRENEKRKRDEERQQDAIWQTEQKRRAVCAIYLLGILNKKKKTQKNKQINRRKPPAKLTSVKNVWMLLKESGRRFVFLYLIML